MLKIDRMKNYPFLALNSSVGAGILIWSTRNKRPFKNLDFVRI
jgi:hypothetical protein